MIFKGINNQTVELKVTNYQFPDKAVSDYWDSNWLNIYINVHSELGNWQTTDPSLTTFELKRVIEWFRDLSLNKVIESKNLYFTEPNLSFDLINNTEDEKEIRMLFDYESKPKSAEKDKKYYVDCVFNNTELEDIALQLEGELVKFPEINNMNKKLNGLPHDMAQSLFSTLSYYNPAYIADWLFNAAKQKNVHEIKLDILNVIIQPPAIALHPIHYSLQNLKKMIEYQLKRKDLPSDFITEAKIEVSIPEFISKNFSVVCTMKDKEGNKYTSDQLVFASTEKEFDVFEEDKANQVNKYKDIKNIPTKKMLIGLFFMSVVSAFALAIFLPVTFVGNSLVTKSTYTIGNPGLPLVYFVVIYGVLLVSYMTTTQEEVDRVRHRRIIIDKPSDILKTLIYSVVIIGGGLIVFLIIPFVLWAYFVSYISATWQIITTIIILYNFLVIYLILKFSIMSKLKVRK